MSNEISTGQFVVAPNMSNVLVLPSGVRLASPLSRLVSYLLETVLVILTLGIGWLVWSMIVWGGGRTPAKVILGQRCVNPLTGMPATWGAMFLREIVAKGFLFSLVSILTAGIGGMILLFMLLWDNRNQQLWDKVATTVVISER